MNFYSFQLLTYMFLNKNMDLIYRCTSWQNKTALVSGDWRNMTGRHPTSTRNCSFYISGGRLFTRNLCYHRAAEKLPVKKIDYTPFPR